MCFRRQPVHSVGIRNVGRSGSGDQAVGTPGARSKSERTIIQRASSIVGRNAPADTLLCPNAGAPAAGLAWTTTHVPSRGAVKIGRYGEVSGCQAVGTPGTMRPSQRRIIQHGRAAAARKWAMETLPSPN